MVTGHTDKDYSTSSQIKLLSLVALFDLKIKAQLLFTTIVQQLNEGERKKWAVYHFFFDFSLVTFFASGQRK